MDAAVTLAAAAFGGAFGGLVGYWLSGMRAQKEWRAKKLAEVLSELYRLLAPVEKTAQLATKQSASLETRKQWLMANKRAVDDLLTYFSGHALWIDAGTLPDIVAFLNDLSSALGPYEAELTNGTPDSPLAVAAVEHVQERVSYGQEVLGTQFSEIVYPPPWWRRIFGQRTRSDS